MGSVSDTIYALSTGSLPSGIAVIRISGDRAGSIALALSGSLPPERVAKYAILKNSDGRELDRGLVLYFAGRASVTGEDLVELHLHGGRAVVASVMTAIATHPGLRVAEPGEFTRRAFLNGKIDLAAAEGIADLIEAETEAQRRFALANASGQQGKIYGQWRDLLIEARALIEAELDFADEDDIPGSVSDQVWTRVERLKTLIAHQLAGVHRAEIARLGFEIVILGAPNVGKSSLLNALIKRDAAIVSPEAGTTRDLIEVSLDLDGQKIIITDTAGIRETDGIVEQIGIERAKRKAEEADLILYLAPANAQAERYAASDLKHRTIGTMADLYPETGQHFDFHVSSETGEGIDTLLTAIGQIARDAGISHHEILPSRERHVLALRNAHSYLLASLDPIIPLELRAEELRLAAMELGDIIGTTRVDDLLDVIFSRFCIGK